MQRDLLNVDWSQIPEPEDDGLANHLEGLEVPDIELLATNDIMINLRHLPGISVIYAYPRTGTPGQKPLFANWDLIPGARGCTPQSCAFRDHYNELKNLGVEHVFGVSTQDNNYQKDAVERLHLPFSLLSDKNFTLCRALNLPTFTQNNITLLKRITLIIKNGFIVKVFYPVFPPDKNTEEVIKWLKDFEKF